MVLITTVVLVNQNRFGGNILVGNLAYDIALSIRQAQVFGLGVREFGVGTGQFDIGYGVHFDISDPTTFRIFADINRNKVYDAGDGTQELFTVGNGYRIIQLCATPASGSEICNGGGNITTLDIDFVRPDPDAYIRVNAKNNPAYRQARITVSSPNGITREVTVESTGQISIPQ
jgi:hypothetical protein